MSYIGQQLPADVFSGFVTDSFTGDGSATTFTLSKAPISEDALIVVINNVIQKPTTNFTVSGTTLTIVGTAVADGDVIYAIHLGGPVASTLASKVDVNGLSEGVILDADADTTISADTDDQIDFKAGGTDIMSLTATTATFNDGVTITTADNSDTLTLISTDADANAGPKIEFKRTSSSPADNDIIGQFTFSAENDAAQSTDYCRFRVHLTDVSDGTEDGNFRLFTLSGGTELSRIDIDATQTIFNEDSGDIDFRVESDSSAYGFYLQAAHASNTGGTIGIASANSDGNRIESVNDQNGVWHMYMNNTHTGANPYGLKIRHGVANDDQNGWFIQCLDTSSVRFGVYNDGDVVNHDNSYGAVSDERIKEQIADASSQWDDVKAMKIRKYKMKEDVAKGDSDAHWRLGVVAQELEASSMNGLVKPEVQYKEGDQEVKDYLYTQKDKDQGLIPDGKDVGDVKQAKTADVGDIKTYKTVKYSVLYMKAIKALQEAMAKIETLETKVKALEDA